MTRKFLWVFLLAAFALAQTQDGSEYTVDSETTGDDYEEDTAIGGTDYGEIFDDYLDDELRAVNVDQDVAIKACVSNSEALVKKIDGSYNKCFKDFEDWNEFQINNVGNDEDKDGLTDKYEEKEACFYRDLGWVVNDKANKEAIKKDFENLNSKSIKDEFITNIEACADWNGKFRERKKRDAEEETWALSLARERREAHYGNGKPHRHKNRNGKVTKRGKGRRHKNGNGKVTKRGKGRRPKNGNGKGNRNRKVTKRGKAKGANGKGNRNRTKRRKAKGGNGNKRGKGKQNKNRNKRKKEKGRNGNKRENGKGNSKAKGKKGNGNDKGKINEQKGNGGKGKGDNKSDNGLTKAEQKTIKQLLPDNVYNEVWCYEISLEKALDHCVVEKLLPKL